MLIYASMSDGGNPRAAKARGLGTLAALLVLLLVPAGELVAQCEPGYDPVEDCSAREAHNKGCRNSYADRLAGSAAAYGVCLAACNQDDDEERRKCRSACTKAKATAAAAASAAFASCRARAPVCVTRCKKNPSHPRWWCPQWPYCVHSTD